MMMTVIEWSGSVLGIVGALLLALNIPQSRFGWIFFAASNVCWIYFGFATGTYSLAAMQIVFSCTSAIGIRNWIIRAKPIAA